MNTLKLSLVNLALITALSACDDDNNEVADKAPQQAAISNFSLSGFNHAESIARDDHYIYASNIGALLDPTGIDGDGTISRMDLHGDNIDLNFITGLNAPKGITIDDGVLYVVDVGELLAFDVETKQQLFTVNFLENDATAVFTNDVVVKDKNTIFVSETNGSRIFAVTIDDSNYANNAFNNLNVAGIPSATNGLSYDASSNTLYAVGFSFSPEADGAIVAIDLDSNNASELSPLKGRYDGTALSVDGQYLLVSDWVSADFAPSEAVGILRRIKLSSGAVETLSNTTFFGPADFLLDGAQLIMPELPQNQVQSIDLSTAQWQ